MKNFLNRLFFGQNTIRGASLILIFTLFLSNLLGLIRDHYLAQKIPTHLLDAYYAAFRLPDFVFNILILGAISAAFIPVFTEFISKKKREEAFYIANSFLNLILSALFISLFILFIFLPYLIPLIVPKFDPEKQRLTLSLTRLFLLSPLFFALSFIFSGILNSFKKFLVYSIAPLVYNLSIILGTIFLADKINVFAPAYGVVIGAFFHMAIQFPPLWELGFRLKLVFDYTHKAVRKIFKLMLPRAIGLGASQILLIVYTAIASRWPASVAVFNLADNIQTMPTVIFGTSFATALFPTLAERASLEKKEDFAFYLEKALRVILFILIPASLGMILLRAQIVRLILGSGYFKWTQTVLTANTLGFFTISLAASGLIPLLARAFYAFQDTKTPTLYSIISVFFSLLFAFLFASKMGVYGLALAFSLGSFLNAFLLYGNLRKKILLPEKKIGQSLFKIILATLVMGLVVQISKNLLGSIVDMQRVWGVATQTLGAILFGLGAYFLTTSWLGAEELNLLRSNDQPSQVSPNRNTGH